LYGRRIEREVTFSCTGFIYRAVTNSHQEETRFRNYLKMAESIQKGREVFTIPGSTPNCGNDFKMAGSVF